MMMVAPASPGIKRNLIAVVEHISIIINIILLLNTFRAIQISTALTKRIIC